MAVALATVFKPYVDEQFATQSKRSWLTNRDFDWTGAHTVKVYKITTSAMNDYGRTGPSEGAWSRYGKIGDLNAVTEEMTLSKDRSFIFNVDKLDQDETQAALNAASALARQIREVANPEIDKYVYGVMCAKAGTKPAAKALTSADIYTDILAASQALDDAEVPEMGRVLVVSPEIYVMLKQNKDIMMETDISAEMLQTGIIGMIDGLLVQKIPANRLPDDFGFMVAHPCATVAPVKLEDYNIHSDTIYGSGSIVTGRICYDAFVLDNKAKAIYYQAKTKASA